MKLQTLTHILMITLCAGVLPQMHGASPAPDGCYPNNTTAEGCKAPQSLTTGVGNTAVGWYSLFATTSGNFNTAVGVGALDLNTADNNTAVGAAALLLNTTGTNNTGGSQAVYVNASGKLGAQVSSRRFKDEIKSMEQTSEVIYRLKPVTYRYNAEIEPTSPLAFGLVAEDVAEVDSDLVTRDKGGKAFSVRYDQVNAMLLNEFLKEHQRNAEQEATIARQQKQIDALIAGLQKVSTEVELNKRTSQVAATGND